LVGVFINYLFMSSDVNIYLYA